MKPRRQKSPGRRIPKWLLLVSLVVVGVWLAFFDSHSLVRRVTWHQEAARLRADNEALRADIERLEVQVEAAQTDEVVETIAREQYGMRRPGERVYRVEAVQP